jgi:hypothetical protein
MCGLMLALACAARGTSKGSWHNAHPQHRPAVVMRHAFCMMYNLSAQLWLVGAVMCGGSSGVVGLIALGQPEALSLTKCAAAETTKQARHCHCSDRCLQSMMDAAD